MRRMDELDRILMLTAESSVESEAEGLAAGADDYVVTPVEPRRLAARVKALWPGRGRVRPARAETHVTGGRLATPRRDGRV